MLFIRLQLPPILKSGPHIRDILLILVVGSYVLVKSHSEFDELIIHLPLLVYRMLQKPFIVRVWVFKRHAFVKFLVPFSRLLLRRLLRHLWRLLDFCGLFEGSSSPRLWFLYYFLNLFHYVASKVADNLLRVQRRCLSRLFVLNTLLILMQPSNIFLTGPLNSFQKLVWNGHLHIA